MGTQIKIAVSFLDHLRAEIEAFKVKGRETFSAFHSRVREEKEEPETLQHLFLSS